VAANSPDLTVWDLVRRAVWHFHKVTSEGHHRARELLLQAIRIDPNSVDAHIWLARASGGIAAYGWSPDAQEMLRDAIEAGDRAVELEGNNPYAHYAAALAYAFAGKNERASIAAERAVSLYPTFATAYFMLGIVRLSQNRIQDSITATEHALRLNPVDPQNFSWFLTLAVAQWFAGDPTAGWKSIDRALQLRPNWVPALRIRAVCEASSGDLQRARQTVAEINSHPKSSGDPSLVVLRHHPARHAEIEAILRSCAE
jgi:adenylate cyclase